MKPTIIFSLVIALLLPLCVHGQVGIGIRDSRYVSMSYTFRGRYMAKLEHSLYAEKFPCQYVRAYIGYRATVGELEVSGEPFYGRTYNSNYWNLGALVNASWRYRWLDVYGTLSPLYDSTFKYKTGFALGAMATVHGPLSLVAEYTTIPVYRMSEKRLRGGLNFRFNSFTCTPLLSIPVSGNGKAKSLRVDFSLAYHF